MSAHDIQALLDEHKEEISDDLYLKLSNLNMKTNNNNNKNKKTFYKALYIIPTIYDVNDNECEYKLELQTELRILEMCEEAYEEMKDRIIETFNSTRFFCQLAQGERHFTKRMVSRYYDDDESEFKYSTSTICYNQKEYLIKLEKIE